MTLANIKNSPAFGDLVDYFNANETRAQLLARLQAIMVTLQAEFLASDDPNEDYYTIMFMLVQLEINSYT